MVTTCCLCGCEIRGYGNNPEPLTDNGRCCDFCNSNVTKFRMLVTPENLRAMHPDYNDKKIKKLYEDMRLHVRKMCLNAEEL